ncbi:MAG: hypothetical protein M1817_003543 [Caeruleum heppii]|nr:MAG: hypothetical protein M1817_003543 [Caeruleum heppii]
MAIQLPHGFISLEEAVRRPNEEVSIIGVVVDHLPPTKSKGPDYMCAFSIADMLWSGQYYGDLKVKYFKPTLSELPSISGTGDVVILRNIRVKEWCGLHNALSYVRTSWKVYPAATIPEKMPAPSDQIKCFTAPTMKEVAGPAERAYVVALCNSQDQSTFKLTEYPPKVDVAKDGTVVQVATAPTSREKFRLLKDVNDYDFSNLIGQVVRTYHPAGDRLELYLTDYTSNDFFYNYEWGSTETGAVSRDGDRYGYVPVGGKKKRKDWPGPFGKMTLRIELLDVHARFAKESVKVGDFVHLRNVRTKFSKVGAAGLEGSLYPDDKYRGRIDVTILDDHDDEQVKAVLRRKQEYWKKAKQQHGDFLDTLKEGKKRAVSDDDDNNEAGVKKKKTRSKKARKARQEEAKEKERLQEIQFKTKLDLNKHVQCEHAGFQPLSLAEILQGNNHEAKTPGGVDYVLPFLNIKYRATVRVVDFFPRRLEDFAVPRRAPEYDVLSDRDSSGSEADIAMHVKDPQSMWEWRFCLLVEEGDPTAPGGKDRLKVMVAGNDAVRLLKMDAKNLRRDKRALEELRERLFILWGNLEELKCSATSTVLGESNNSGNRQAAVNPSDGAPTSYQPQKSGLTATKTQATSKAFRCCLKEYGVPTKGKDRNEPGTWQRRYRMFDTWID